MIPSKQICGKNLVVLSLLVLITSFTTRALAWSYPEHVGISQAAFANALKELKLCDELDDAGDSTGSPVSVVDQICHVRKVLGFCYAHMVALSGDRIENVESILDIKESDKRFLVKPQLDCRNLSKLVEQSVHLDYEGAPLEYFEFPDCLLEADEHPLCEKMMKTRFIDHIRYVKLAADNKSHFQPWSVYDEWEIRTEALLNMQTGKSLHELFAAHAFGMHFFQDSFSAGHLGLNRKITDQDYSQAYHDDFNETGRYIVSDKDTWYGYGDGHIHENTLYFVAKTNDFNHDDIKTHLEAIDKDEHLKAFLGLNWRDTDLALTSIRIETAPRKIPLTSSKPKVLSIPVKLNNGGPFLCGIFPNCEKIEILLLEKLAGVEEDGIPEKLRRCKSQPGAAGKYYSCPETEIAVMRASTENAKLLFQLIMQLDKTSLETQHALARSHLPSGYSELIGSNDRSLNTDPILLYYAEYKNTESTRDIKEKLRYTSWGVNFASQKSGLDHLRQKAITLGNHSKIKTGAGEFAVSFQGDVINDEEDLLNNIELGWEVEAGREFYKTLAAGLRLSAGLNNIQHGEKKQNEYAGIGITGNFHAGRRIFYFDIMRNKHYGNGSDTDYSTKFTFGYRFSFIDLNQYDNYGPN